jgi:hypothetical protein
VGGGALSSPIACQLLAAPGPICCCPALRCHSACAAVLLVLFMPPVVRLLVYTLLS